MNFKEVPTDFEDISKCLTARSFDVSTLILKLFNGFGFCELVVLHSGAARLYVKLADYFPEGFAPTARNSPVYSGMYNIITFAVIVCCIRTINSHESTQL